jgi:hypothetical protein
VFVYFSIRFFKGKTMETTYPDTIYRYQRFSAQSVQLLCHDELYFSDAASFNDPLDCQPHVESGTNVQEMQLILTKLISHRVQQEAKASLIKVKLKDSKALEYAKDLGGQAAQHELQNIAYNATNPEYDISEEAAKCWLLTHQIQTELLKRYDKGICCFSSSFKDPLLWSHYGDQHKGFHVGYSPKRRPKPIMKQIEYGGDRIIPMDLITKAILGEIETSISALDKCVLMRKAPSWNYEEEWRLIGRKGVQDSPLLLKEVTFGLRCHSSIKYAVVSALKSREEKITFYEMGQIRGSFELNREVMDEGEMMSYYPKVAQSGEEIFGHLPPV